MSAMTDVPAVPIAFKRNAREALADPQLRRNFRGAMDFLMDNREEHLQQFDRLPEEIWEAHRRVASDLG